MCLNQLWRTTTGVNHALSLRMMCSPNSRNVNDKFMLFLSSPTLYMPPGLNSSYPRIIVQGRPLVGTPHRASAAANNSSSFRLSDTIMERSLLGSATGHFQLPPFTSGMSNSWRTR